MTTAPRFDRLGITIILDNLARAGAQLQAAMLAEELARTGHGVTILLLEHPADEPLPEIPGVAVLSVPVGPLNRWSTLDQVWKLRRILKGLRPDVVHTFLFKANLVGALAARLAGIPVVVGSRRSMGYDLNRRRAILSCLGNRLVDGVAANARAIVREASSREGCRPPNPVVIPNGVRMPAHHFLPEPAPSWRLGILANIRPVKGHEVALRALAEIRRRHPACELHLMGDRRGEPAWTRKLESLAGELGVADALVWHDPAGDVPTFLAGLDVLLAPSHSEGLSNALLEGMATGLPVIATDVGGNGEALGEAGILVPAADPGRLAEAVIDLMETPDRRRELGTLARLRAEREFSPAVMAARQENWYRWLLNTARGLRRRRRVVLAIDILDTGGTETQVRHWALGLAGRGIPVTILCLRAGGRVADELGAAGIDVRILGKRHRFDLLFLLRQQWQLMRLRPWTVLALLTTAGVWTVPAARLAGVPRVLFSMRATTLTDDPRVEGPRALLTRSLRWAARVVGNSPEVLDYCRDQLAVPADKTDLLPNIILGAELREIPRAEMRARLGLPQDGPLIGIVARLVPVKDHELFLRTCEHLFRNVPGVRAVIVGDGPEAARILARITELGLQERVRMVGHRRDAARWLRAMDAAVLTSRSEGSPNAVLEALAVGTPVVSVDVGDVARFVGGSGGRVVPSRDPRRLAAALVAVLSPSHQAPPTTLVQNHAPEQVLTHLQNLFVGQEALA